MPAPPRALSTVSTDGGRTENVTKQEPDLWNAKAKAFSAARPGGTHFSVFKDGPATPATLAPTGRTSLRYPLKPFGGAWSAETTYDDAGPKNSCPTLIEVAARDFRAVWDSGTKDRSRTDIRFGQFLVSDQPCAHFTDE